MADVDEQSWKFRAETAEALLEAEREEVERLRAYIKELEAKLPDEEGGEEEPQPAKGRLESSLDALLEMMGPQHLAELSPQELSELMKDIAPPKYDIKQVDPHMIRWDVDYGPLPPRKTPYFPKLRRKDRPVDVAAEVSLEVRRNVERNEEARVCLKMADGRQFNYAVGPYEINNLRCDPRRAKDIIQRITEAFRRSVGDEIPEQTLRGSIGSVIMDLIEGGKRERY